MIWAGVLLTGLLAAPQEVPLEAPASRSVYRISPWADGPIIGVAALGIVVPELLASKIIVPRCPCDPAEVPRLDRSVIGNSVGWTGPLSDVTLGVSLILPLVLDAVDVGFSRELAEDTVVYAEAILVSGALVSLSKFTLQRPRPFAYTTTSAAVLNDPYTYESFYSAHTSLVVAALTAASFTYTRRHGPAVWPWAVTAVVGLSVAAERVASGNHFYTDVALGAAAGFACGYVLPLLHARAPVVAGLSLAPVPGGAQLSFSRRF